MGNKIWQNVGKLTKEKFSKQLVNKPQNKTNIGKLLVNKLYQKDLYSKRFVNEPSTKFTKFVYLNELVNHQQSGKHVRWGGRS